MATVEKARPLAGFTRLSNQVYVRPADSSTGTCSDVKDPTTILIYGWGDGQPKHVVKFVAGYLKLYPSARIVLILGPILKMFFETLEQRTRSMDPVLYALRDSSTAGGRRNEEEDRILVHVMSSTGGVNYAGTLHAHNQGRVGKRGGDGDGDTKLFPHALTVLDSTPGSTSVRANIGPWSRAMTIGAGFSGPLLGLVVQGLSACFLLATHGLMWLVGQDSPAVFSSRAINDPDLEALAARRLCLYGPGDEIIAASAIEAHSAAARAKGYKVDLESFDGSGHVGHMRAYPERYWGAIKDAWEKASRDT
jgi:pimeloyl-ACP methyl ester carboxylesterase